MAQYTITDLDPLFTNQFDEKLEQYRLLACLPPELCEQEAVIQYTLQLLQELHPVLGAMLDAELAAGNTVRTACQWGVNGLLDVALVHPFRKQYKARHLEYLLVKDPHDGSDSAWHYQQYTCTMISGQRLLSGIQ